MSIEAQRLLQQEVTQTEFLQVTPIMQHLLEELKPNIEYGRYGLVIGDDTSATHPAIMVHYAMTTYALQNELPVVPLIFVQGSSLRSNIPNIHQAIEAKRSVIDRCDPNKKALLITEHVGTGHSLLNFLYALNKSDITADIGAVTTCYNRDYYDFIKAPLFVGNEDSKTGTVFHIRENLTGKTREKFPKERFLGVRTQKYLNDGEKEKVKVVFDTKLREEVKSAHRQARMVSEELYEKVFIRNADR